MTDGLQLPDLIWDWAKTTGPAGFALIVWYLERMERLALQKRNDTLVDRLEKVATDAAGEIRTIKDLLTSGRRNAP